MTDVYPLATAFGVGILLGVFYFGGLWWTVRKGVVSAAPALWFAGSMFLRTGVALLGFYFIGRGHWQRLLVCLLGFIVCRVFVMRLIPQAKTSSTRSSQETYHAS